MSNLWKVDSIKFKSVRTSLMLVANALFSERPPRWICSWPASGNFLVMKQTTTAVINLINARARRARLRRSPSPSASLSSPRRARTTHGRMSIMTSPTTDSSSSPSGHSSLASNTRDRSGLKSTSSRSPSRRARRISSTARRSSSPCAMEHSTAPPSIGTAFSSPLQMDLSSAASRMFQGRVSTVDNVGRTQATLTVASDLVILDYDMPKNLFSPTCLHVLYDAGCGIVRGTFSIRWRSRGRFELEHNQFFRRSRGRRSRIACLLVRRQRQRARDGQERQRRRRSIP